MIAVGVSCYSKVDLRGAYGSKPRDKALRGLSALEEVNRCDYTTAAYPEAVAFSDVGLIRRECYFWKKCLNTDVVRWAI